MRIRFLLPKCTPDNSHGRYVIELCRRLASGRSVVVHSGTFWPPLRSIAECRRLPVIQRPALARIASLWADSLVTSRAGRQEIVHVQGADAPIGNVVTAHFCNEVVRPMVRRYGGLYRRFNYALGAAVERFTMTRPWFRRIIAVSRMLKDDLVREYGVDAQKITVIHHGVDLEGFNPRYRHSLRERTRMMHGIRRGEFVVLFVGGDYRGKGLLPLLEAVATLPVDVKVLAVGVSPDRGLMRAISERLLSTRTVLIPPTADIVGYYAAADCFVLPTQYDTFSLVTLEAMASGLPVVVSARAGICEILTHGVDSLVLDDPTDPVALRGILSELREQEPVRTRLAHEARATAEKHSWDRVAAETLQVYDEALTDSA